jgi:hypothetical protein
MAENQPSTVTFHYVKSNLFRVVHVNGAFGGLSPDGNMFIALYSERAPLPDVTVQKIEDNGQIGAELVEQRQSSGGIVREMEVGLAMDIRTARIFRDWLTERIDLADKITAGMQHPRTEVKQ